MRKIKHILFYAFMVNSVLCVTYFAIYLTLRFGPPEWFASYLRVSHSYSIKSPWEKAFYLNSRVRDWNTSVIADRFSDRLRSQINIKNATVVEQITLILREVKEVVLTQCDIPHRPLLNTGLLLGIGYCDQVNSMAAIILARFFRKAQLLYVYDAKNSSPHTIGRVLTRDFQWYYFDIWPKRSLIMEEAETISADSKPFKVVASIESSRGCTLDSPEYFYQKNLNKLFVAQTYYGGWWLNKFFRTLNKMPFVRKEDAFFLARNLPPMKTRGVDEGETPALIFEDMNILSDSKELKDYIYKRAMLLATGHNEFQNDSHAEFTSILLKQAADYFAFSTTSVPIQRSF